ncbi:MAG: flagellar brake protein [Gammaproteobacteria bacterium]
MFDTLKKLFSSKKQRYEPLEEDSGFEPDFPDNPNFVEEKGKVVRLLKDVASEISLCTIEIEDFDGKYTSSILDAQEEKNAFVLDELTPYDGNKYLLFKDKFKLSTRLRGIPLSFYAESIESGVSNEIAYYKVKLPDKIYYPQRRMAPRVTFDALQIAFHGISSKNQITVAGHVLDISRGGIGIRLSDNRARAQRGEKLINCSIRLPGNFEVNFDLEIRSIKTTTGSNSIVKIGGYFKNLSSKTEKKLGHFLTSLEREEIRKRRM